MNEKIKEIIVKSNIDIRGHYDESGNTPQQLQEFAELIIQECATAFETEVDTWKEMDPYQGSIKRQGTKAIKQHFGVEE